MYRTTSWFLGWLPYEYCTTSGRTCILLWILYGNMVDFSFIVSLYVSDLPNVTISTVQQLPNLRTHTIRYRYFKPSRNCRTVP